MCGAFGVAHFNEGERSVERGRFTKEILYLKLQYSHISFISFLNFFVYNITLIQVLCLLPTFASVYQRSAR